MPSSVAVASRVRGSGRLRRLGIAAAAIAAGAPVIAWQAAAGGAPLPALAMSPAPGTAPYRAGQAIKLSVGPNHYFTPFSRVVILQCADRKGRAENLPKDDSTCDGNTVQGDSVLVNKDGSFREAAYQLFALPDPVLSERPTARPVCDRSHYCVLYVGQNQNNFKAPKLFSAAFTIVRKARSHHS
jgi:hypothetical protein